MLCKCSLIWDIQFGLGRNGDSRTERGTLAVGMRAEGRGMRIFGLGMREQERGEHGGLGVTEPQNGLGCEGP